MKLALIGAAYVAILAFAAVQFHERYLWAVQNPVDASGGMAAFGDWVLEVFIAFLFMIPTLCLVWVGAKFESPYTRYSETLLIVGLSAPLSLAFVFLSGQVSSNLAAYCFVRLLWSPFILGLILVSRLMARFDRAKRLTSYALLAEAATFCASIGLVVVYTVQRN